MDEQTDATPAAAQDAIAALARQRVEYDDVDIDLPADTPHGIFSRWYEEAGEALGEPNAMVVATDDDAGPAARIVLLKGFDARGFVFYTNYQSAKGRQIEAHPLVALVFPWHDMQRQVRVRGLVSKVMPEESDAYFALRPRGSQIGAAASAQSQPVRGRDAFAQTVEELEARWEGKDVERPAHWGGYRVQPYEIEFWQGRLNRMHDRFLFTSRDGRPAPLDDAATWSAVRLQP
ncbi:MAG: pyridoxamine 5'-phosphate oxidase [Brevibacterium yomogidense]|uniref:Pyridoxine/pyridoxamine 5'-phosphate oxidase n=1 Tax=Brevibacterium yomogidense TaxID=946573 RepID=A0A1X6XMA3_9MICO|nr:MULTISPECIES: pyridoxamine 5'-phosphate oxidase [Brevibacterium]SLN00465.1 Pyridoxamine 5'-phosphate oxidase [Brevibacterium yomogidense]SMX72444.1 Pyridoxamine 5'-phosphate oxidase [Brevibacterium sp. Mu109]